MRCHTIDLPADPAHVRTARDWVRSLLYPRTPEAAVHDALLITSDLATDAVVRHFEPAYRLHAAVSPMTLYLEAPTSVPPKSALPARGTRTRACTS
jgi:hypothetical protein